MISFASASFSQEAFDQESFEFDTSKPIQITFLDGGGGLARMLRTPKYVKHQRDDEAALMLIGAA